MKTLKIKKDSIVTNVAGAIAGEMRACGEVELIAVGPHAVNQAVKSIAAARGYAVQDGYDLCTQPSFAHIQIEGEDRNAIRLQVKKA